MSDIYVNCKGSIGEGSVESPINYQQLRRYFNPDLGIDTLLVPVDGDIIHIKGIIDVLENGEVFNLGRTVHGTITVKAWDIWKNGLWTVDVTYENADEIILVANTGGCFINNLDISDFRFIKPAI